MSPPSGQRKAAVKRHLTLPYFIALCGCGLSPEEKDID